MNLSPYPTIVDGKTLSALVMCMDAILRKSNPERIAAYDGLKTKVLAHPSQQGKISENPAD